MKMQSTMEFNQVITALADLKEDMGVPRNVKSKINAMIADLSDGRQDNSMLINKLLNELDEMSGDINLQPFVRTQMYNISSMLEAFN